MTYELIDLTIGYGKTVVADGINATLEEGKMACLIGQNGAGKSTLLRTLCCFQPSLDGKKLLDGKDVSRLSAQELSTMIGVVLTDRVDVQGMTVRELVAMGRSPYTDFWGKLKPEDETIVEEAIRLTGIEALASRQINTLSDGERQKVMIAKTLAQQTPIILLDEPTAFLDFPSKVETMLLLKRLAHEQGKSILISTHDLDLALQTADTLWLMGKSSLIVGPPSTLAQDNTLALFFANPNVHFNAGELRFTIKR